jgi:hypothetical protein
MTLGAPSLARVGSGQAGEDSSSVRPITPGKGVPGLYSIILDIFDFPFHVLLSKPLLSALCAYGPVHGISIECGPPRLHVPNSSKKVVSAPARLRSLHEKADLGRMLKRARKLDGR